MIIIEKEDLEKMRKAVDEFLELRNIVTEKWSEGTVLEEIRGARRHETENSNARC